MDTTPSKNAKEGNVKYFEQVAVDTIQIYTDRRNGDSVLSLVASSEDKLDCCEVIYRRCPELLYQVNNNGCSVLHEAAASGRDENVAFFLDVGRDEAAAGGRVLLTMKDKPGNTALHYAVLYGNRKSTELLLGADPSNTLLGMVNKEKDTPMHLAVKKHRLHCVGQLLEAGPAYLYLLNTSGKTPHSIALEESLRDDETKDIMKLLIEKQPQECKKRTGSNGWTLLQHASFTGNMVAVEWILQFCPDSAQISDGEGQNFVHLAAKNEHEQVLRYIMASTRVNNHVLNKQDIDGNTPFHIVTSKGNQSMGLLMLYDTRVGKEVKNNLDQLAIDAIHYDYDKRRARVHRLRNRVDEKDLKDRSDFDLLVGALISTVSFTIGMTAPGGFISSSEHQGNAVLHKSYAFRVFIVSNTIALTLSLYSVFSHFCTKYLIDYKDIMYQLHVATFCSIGSIIAMMVAFMTGSYAILVVSPRLAITVCVICGCFFIFAIPTMLMLIRKKINSA